MFHLASLRGLFIEKYALIQQYLTLRGVIRAVIQRKVNLNTPSQNADNTTLCRLPVVRRIWIDVNILNADITDRRV